MGRSKLPDFDAEQAPELGGLPVLSQLVDAPLPSCVLKGQIALAFGERSRSRLRIDCHLISNASVAVPVVNSLPIAAAIVLPRGSVVRGGRWVCDEKISVQILAADEDLIEVRAKLSEESNQNAVGLALLKAAYHLGNRHVPLQVEHDHLKLEYDYVLVDMLVAMGLRVQRRYGPFEPEWGAYAHVHHS